MEWVGETREGHPPSPHGGPNLTGLFPETSVVDLVPGTGVPGRGFKSDQPTGSLCALPRAGHNIDPGLKEPTLPQVPQVLRVCVAQGPQ